ncbi:HAD-IIB family hydrolase [Mycoplasma sp. 1654_15]|uniref:HAD-IIB family hydrolase n=1 Tax=Mycoplasma sp. 1654_15 TaxID=2725994 RepID=UPI0014492549|nr:HAD-IIB family hydrolase [Mycoplasma sp. 1654_15]QJB70970.1 HAD-IIB family hydrolase [Mycoplasma sp. 1654_15]
MLKKKIFFIDLDGTLLDSGYGRSAKMSKRNEQAVLKASKKNIIVISTGRKYSSKVQNISKKIGAKYIACLNGALILQTDNQSVLKSEDINEIVVKEVFEIAQNNNICFSTDTEKILFGEGIRSKILAFITSLKAESFKTFKVKTAKKILLMSFSTNNIEIVFKQIKNKYEGFLNLALVAKGRAIEITSKPASKGEVIKFIAALENINLKNTVHIGDSMNDASTKNIAGQLIALKSGSKNLQKIADKVDGKIKYSAVAKILRKEENNNEK